MQTAAMVDGSRGGAILLAVLALGAGCGQRPPMVPEIAREVIGTEAGFRSGMPTSNNPPPS